MGAEPLAAEAGRSPGRGPVERLLHAIGYPERMSGGSMPFALRVDGMEILADEMDGRAVLSYVLANDDSLIPALAGYAAGRMLEEDAVLAYSAPGHQTFLWQDAPQDAGARDLVRLFETFMDSCDWWRERVGALRGGDEGVPEADMSMVIRP